MFPWKPGKYNTTEQTFPYLCEHEAKNSRNVLLIIVNLCDNQFPNRTIMNIELRPAKEKTIMDNILSGPLGLCRVVNGAQVRIRNIELRKYIKPNDFNPCHVEAMCSMTQCTSHSVLCTKFVLQNKVIFFKEANPLCLFVIQGSLQKCLSTS
jgi:hypothetical protein